MAGSFDVVCPARLRVEKNHVGLLRVFSRVRESVPRARLLLPGDGPMLPEIRTAIEAVGLQRDVELLGHVDDMPALYARSRAVCLLSEAEGPSLGVLEGASRGRPSVVTDVGGLKDSVVDGVTGFRVGYGDEKAAERALVMLMTDDSVCRSMGQAAAAFVREERSLSRVAKTYANYLQEVSKRRQRS